MSNRRNTDACRAFRDEEHSDHCAGAPPWCAPDDPDTVRFSRFPDSMAREYGGGARRPADLSAVLDFIHVRCPKNPRGCPACGCLPFHADSLVVAVDGACPANGTPAAGRSACGVYFGPDNPHNRSILLPPGVDRSGAPAPHTNQRAEVHAAIAGLMAARPFCEDGGQWNCADCPDGPCPVRHLVVKSDSAYLVDAMGGGKNGEPARVKKWLDNGWRSAQGDPVKNQDLFRSLLSLLVKLKRAGAAVEFWHVPRSENREADELANAALR